MVVVMVMGLEGGIGGMDEEGGGWDEVGEMDRGMDEEGGG